MTSERLPGKVLADICGKPMLLRVIERLALVSGVEKLVVAIPNTKENDVLEKILLKNNIEYSRGDEKDVLSRYYDAAKKNHLEHVIRITSDCPLIDYELVNSVIQNYVNSGADYTSNSLSRTFPRGTDVEIFTFKTLERAHREAVKDYQREHVTPYIYEHPETFKLQNVEAEGKLRRQEIRLTVDTKDDLTLIRKIYENFKLNKRIFLTKDIIDFLDSNLDLLKINAHISQKSL